jgi:hypothetical protein
MLPFSGGQVANTRHILYIFVLLKVYLAADGLFVSL